MPAAEVRAQLVDALQLDLIGPNRKMGDPNEVLPQDPSRWYLTGYIAPFDTDPKERADEDVAEEIDNGGETGAGDDEAVPDTAAARQSFFPSSIGMSLLVAAETKRLTVVVRWGDYRWDGEEKFELSSRRGDGTWRRTGHEQTITLELPASTNQPRQKDVPNSQGLKIEYLVRPVPTDGNETSLPKGTRSVSVFLVNRRTPERTELRDQAFAFQTSLEVSSEAPFVARPDPRSMHSEDWDERVADLQYRDVCEYAVGHNVATEAVLDDQCHCRIARTCWIPSAEVERVAPPNEIPGVTLGMDELSVLADHADAQANLGAMVAKYRDWLEGQAKVIPKLPARRAQVAEELIQRARHAARRIQEGIDLLADPNCLEAFRLANRVMAKSARQRQGVHGTADAKAWPAAAAAVTPKWRPFQLAFVLMNLRGIAEPTHADRSAVDLLFFPTGGGKTEAYLGLAAFTLVLRRLRNPGIASAGLSVLMRYTLRLLTLDQMGRAATLICALELEREKDVNKLGIWPFEIGLWVGKAATPNVMGRKGDNFDDTARAKTIAYGNNDSKPRPIPIEECPWCGSKLEVAKGDKKSPFTLYPNRDEPLELRIHCLKRGCDFSDERHIPLVAVDESIYRRLPCFMIATVDKFAAMPWTGEVGKFFGRADRYDNKFGFFGPCDGGGGRPLPGGRLLPPELIIQDELHLISGPLGTIAGLYEAALDELCCHEVDGQKVRPKIVASTATVRRAESQIQALFDRRTVDIFPPPGPDRRNSFFAETHTREQSNPRLYVGIAAAGRSPKVTMLRAYLTLLAAAQRAFEDNGGEKTAANPADPYMTLLGYFNSLRELGGARRIVEDEVGTKLTGYSLRKRVGEEEGLFANRTIAYEVVELTSRVSTTKVSEAKRLLSQSFDKKEHVDVALATNMISVGLDIVRLGLMVVFGQPKTSAEYIQASSRVGRDVNRPGLVVTILNVNRPRDRSHYERFAAFHQTFYRSVEATSVTPFSPRALDRALAGTVIALARQKHKEMTPPKGAEAALRLREKLSEIVNYLGDRAYEHAAGSNSELRERFRTQLRERATKLLDEWVNLVVDYQRDDVSLQYNISEAGGAKPLLRTFLDPELKSLPRRHRLFRANRSMRDVEPSVNLRLKTLDGFDVTEEDE
jgi:hypothetical protein